MKILLDTVKKTFRIVEKGEEENLLDLYVILNKLDKSWDVINGNGVSLNELLKKQKEERKQIESKIQNIPSTFLKTTDIKLNVIT